MKNTRLLLGPEPVMRVVLGGTLVVVSLMTMMLLISYGIVGNRYVLPRIGGALVALGYICVALLLYRKKRFRAVAWMLLVFYITLGIVVVALWGVNTPIAVLIIGFSIILSGIILGARSIWYTTLGITMLLCAVQYATQIGLLHPDTSTLSLPPTFMDVVSHCLVFILFAMVAWLAGRRSELLLEKSQRAEEALKREKDLLSVRLEQKSREVREAQLEEMRQLYQFAELGQLGAVLLHDLANNLTALTLDIEDIGSQLQRNESITRAKESIAYLETMVNGVRRQIHERDKPIVFDATLTILETIASLGTKARRFGVSIDYAPGGRQPFMLKGDPIRFAHILTILITNALEAYEA